jgi:hypothetical protein
MPDDDKEVKEQTAEESFDEVFGEEPEIKDPDDDDEVVEEGGAEEEEEKEGEEDKEETDEQESEEAPEEDEVETRGREILEEEQARKREQQEHETRQRQVEESRPQPVSTELAQSLATMVSPNLLPETDIDINGVSVNLRTYMEDNPEVAAIAGVAFREGMNRLVRSGYVMLAKDVNERIDTAVFNSVISSRHRDAAKVVQSEEFGKWLESEAKDEEKALFRSKDPMDHVLALDRFKNRDAIKQARAKKAEKEKEAKEKKEKHKDLHKHTGRAKTVVSEGSGTADDFDSAFDEAQEKAEKGEL